MASTPQDNKAIWMPCSKDNIEIKNNTFNHGFNDNQIHKINTNLIDQFQKHNSYFNPNLKIHTNNPKIDFSSSKKIQIDQLDLKKLDDIPTESQNSINPQLKGSHSTPRFHKLDSSRSSSQRNSTSFFQSNIKEDTIAFYDFSLSQQEKNELHEDQIQAIRNKISTKYSQNESILTFSSSKIMDVTVRDMTQLDQELQGNYQTLYISQFSNQLQQIELNLTQTKCNTNESKIYQIEEKSDIQKRNLIDCSSFISSEKASSKNYQVVFSDKKSSCNTIEMRTISQVSSFNKERSNTLSEFPQKNTLTEFPKKGQQKDEVYETPTQIHQQNVIKKLTEKVQQVFEKTRTLENQNQKLKQKTEQILRENQQLKLKEQIKMKMLIEKNIQNERIIKEKQMIKQQIQQRLRSQIEKEIKQKMEKQIKQKIEREIKQKIEREIKQNIERGFKQNIQKVRQKKTQQLMKTSTQPQKQINKNQKINIVKNSPKQSKFYKEIKHFEKQSDNFSIKSKKTQKYKLQLQKLKQMSLGRNNQVNIKQRINHSVLMQEDSSHNIPRRNPLKSQSLASFSISSELGSNLAYQWEENDQKLFHRYIDSDRTLNESFYGQLSLKDLTDKNKKKSSHSILNRVYNILCGSQDKTEVFNLQSKIDQQEKKKQRRQIENINMQGKKNSQEIMVSTLIGNFQKKPSIHTQIKTSIGSSPQKQFITNKFTNKK